MINISFLRNRSCTKWSVYMSIKTSSKHFIDIFLLHSSIMIFDKLRQIFLIIGKSLLIRSLVTNSHIIKIRLGFSWFDLWRSSPILECLIICCRANKAGAILIAYWSISCFLWLGFHFKCLVKSFIIGDKVPLNFVWYLQILFLFVYVKYLRFGIWIKLAIFCVIKWFHILWVFVEQIPILAFHAFTARNASIILFSEIFIQISFQESSCLHLIKWYLWLQRI